MCTLKDVAVPVDRNVMQKEAEKKLNYKILCIVIQWMWNTECRTIPVITGATGIVRKIWKKNSEAISGKCSRDSLQKTAILGTSHIIWEVLQSEPWSLSGGDHYWFKGRKGKDKVHPTKGHEDPEGKYSYISTLSLTSAVDGVGSESQVPAALPQGRSGWVWKISLPPGFGPRTVQPVVSRCTDWAIPIHVSRGEPERKGLPQEIT